MSKVYDRMNERIDMIDMTDADKMNNEDLISVGPYEDKNITLSTLRCSTLSLRPVKNSSNKVPTDSTGEKIPTAPLPLYTNDYVCSYDDLNRLSQYDPFYKKYLLKPITVQEGLLQIIKKYDPNYFLTFQLPSKRRTYDEFVFRPKLQKVLSSIEWRIEGRNWFKHPLPFICFMEKGISGYWHAHILFKSDKDIYTIRDALNKVRTAGGKKNKNKKKIRLPRYSFNIQAITKHSTEVNAAYDLTKHYYKKRKTDKRQKIDEKQKVIKRQKNDKKRKPIKKPKLICNQGVELYCIKELYPDCNGNFDSDRIVFSEDLFTFDKKNENL